MINRVKYVLLTTIILFAVCIASHVSAQEKQLSQDRNEMPSKPPAFKDNGKAMQTLKTEYKCETIEFENWEDDDATDSTLTVCLVNSGKLPTGTPDEIYHQIHAIAARVKQAVQYPNHYRSFYIIFVNTDKEAGMLVESHANGAAIPASSL